MAVEFIWEDRGVVRKFYGQITVSDVIDSTRQLASDPRFDALRYKISDYSEGASPDFDLKDLELLSAETFGAALSNQRILSAAVTTDPVVLDIIEQFQQMIHDPYLKVFPTLAQARDWIAAHPPLRPF
jgi:hypothetical protein